MSNVRPMSVSTLPPCLVVASATHVELELLKLPPVEVEFDSPAEEQRYEEADNRLAVKIQEAIVALSGEAEGELFHTNWDWFPSKSRSVELDVQAFSLALVRQLVSLLTAEYADWRIHLNVYRSLAQHAQDFGVACLFAHRIILERSLHEKLSTEA